MVAAEEDPVAEDETHRAPWVCVVANGGEELLVTLRPCFYVRAGDLEERKAVATDAQAFDRRHARGRSTDEERNHARREEAKGIRDRSRATLHKRRLADWAKLLVGAIWEMDQIVVAFAPLVDRQQRDE